MKHIILYLLLIFTSVAQAEFSRTYLDTHPLKMAQVNGIEIAYRTVGEGEGRPKVVVIMGLGGSNVAWGDNMIRGLAEAGYQVLMFDNRDTGASTRFDQWGQPTLWLQLLKRQLNLPVNAPYSLDDMAADAVGLMDALGYQDGHIIGTSMGGMIAQIVAAKYPQRTRSLISIMSTTGARHLPPPTNLAETRLRNLAEGEAEEEREASIRARGFYPASMPRHLMAVFKVGDRSAEVATIQADTLVLHGVDDGLIPPAHGEHTAELIKGSKYVLFEGMGHNLPPAVIPDLIANMTSHINAVEAATEALAIEPAP
ncbi:MAG: alpha/beta fold hydrolase [Porticoccaceae bacterium]|jgi:pimeloyl-ACP methyl ester carboxylesterase|nr:alpha/beta fold hydrolase [Porticoccaceae bacterium]MBT6320312.1 alpha/beta fold hydrolase [Porticoccaceae bacterium]MBT7904086.1 alpha/beta fold hydrolase [Porticoccaceae bacterium]MDB2554627.1 alpha/beta fold hydrolase [Porticoccaceae bacterium]